MVFKKYGNETSEKRLEGYYVYVTRNHSFMLHNGIDVYGSYELSVKSNLISAIDNGDDFYIGVGFNDERDYYSATNIEAMCRFLLDYVDSGVLEKLDLEKDGF